MPSLLLPTANRPRWLLAFWLVCSPFIGLLAATCLSLPLSLAWILLAFLLTVVFFAPVFFNPYLAVLPYRAWNKIGRIFGHYAHLFLLKIIFYVILIAVGRTGSHLRLQRSEESESQWIERETVSTDAYHTQYRVPGAHSFDRSWTFTFISWSIRSGNFWTVFLFPFIFLLSSLDTGQEENFPAGIYTLF